MALRSEFKSRKDGGKHTVTLEVSLTGGGEKNAEIEISWGANDLGYPEQVSPSTAVISATKVVWAEQEIDEEVRTFEVTLHCATAGQHTVHASGKVLPGGSPYTTQTTLDC